MKKLKIIRNESERSSDDPILSPSRFGSPFEENNVYYNQSFAQSTENVSKLKQISSNIQISTVMEAANYVAEATKKVPPFNVPSLGHKSDKMDKPLLESGFNQNNENLSAQISNATDQPSSSSAHKKSTQVQIEPPQGTLDIRQLDGGHYNPMAIDNYYSENERSNAFRPSSNRNSGLLFMNDRTVDHFQDHATGDLSQGNESIQYFRRRVQSSRGSISSTATSTRGSTITYHNISYIVKTKKYPWSKQESRIVLNNVSGIMRPGMNAIMGPTGSGKSSLLDVLAGRKDPRFLEGSVLVDGSIQASNFKCISGYVVQDDIVMGTLTVRENLRFSAALRLSRKWSDKDREEKVDKVLEELGLSHVADSKVGTEFIRGVSGGERKRCNIGMELITDPSVLFLDEPTTGLDAFTANSVISTLRTLARRGRTIIFSIHQPKYTIYKLFETLTLVYKGECIYQGPADRAPLDYFSDIGYIIESYNNPADFYMDILHGEAKPIDYQEQMLVSNNDDAASLSGIEAVLDTPPEMQLSERFSKSWKDSEQYKLISNEVERIFTDAQVPRDDHMSIRKSDIKISYKTNFGTQLGYVCKRTLLNMFRNPNTFLIQLGVYLFFSLFDGIVFLQLNNDKESGYTNRRGLFFFLCLQIMFINIAAIEIFIKERPLFIHESMSGYYRVSVYFIAKVFCDMLPVRAISLILFMPIVYFMAGLRVNAAAYFFFLLMMFLTSVVGCSVAYFFSALISVMEIANLCVSISYVFMMVFSGVLINLSTMYDWINWGKYFSAFRYSINALSINEMKYTQFCSFNGTQIIENSCEYGTTYLYEQSIYYRYDFDLWVNIMALAIFSIAFLVGCYFRLKLMNKYK